MSTDHQLETAFGTFTLERFPKPTLAEGKQQPLRAWDAADELLLQWLDEQRSSLPEQPQTLILNDSFGALTTALNSWPCWSQTDSLLAHQGCVQNLQANVADPTAASARLLTSLQWPTHTDPLVKTDPLLKTMQLVVIKIPKTLSLLEDQLFHLRQVVDEHTVVVAGAMTKNIHNSTLELFERILGITTTSRATKKARLIFCQLQPSRWQGPSLSFKQPLSSKQSPYPSQYTLPEFPFAIHNCANVFSRGGLDIGTRFLLEHFPRLPSAQTIIDLGCGNGLLGIQAKRLHPQAHIRFVDESYMAVESARLNVKAAHASGYINISSNNINISSNDTEINSNDTDINSNDINGSTMEFQVNNSLAGMDNDQADLIVNNPPFHQQTVIGDHIAWQMFTDAKRVLRQGGELWVVGNRHLDYHLKLKRLFGHCDTVAANRKFVILRAVKR